jgi:4-hydroxy 2-oxovalerate aldolase
MGLAEKTSVKGPMILDTTLREGSYVTNFQFNDEDTWEIASRLDKAGVNFIEIGHGLGLGAFRHETRFSNPSQAVSDEAYMSAAADAVSIGEWGAFIIPGVGNELDIKLAADHGAGFLRVGTDITRVEQAEPFIRYAKSLGLTVFANLMKSYGLSPALAAEKGWIAEGFGADYICIVDSAGGMFPEEVRAYILAMLERCTVPVNFHGHNNLGLANSNTLEAFRSGARVLDTTLRGLGRSGGNACTEQIALSLIKLGYSTGLHIVPLLDAAEIHVDPVMRRFLQSDSLTTVSGYSRFHSSGMGEVLTVASSLDIDPRELLLSLGSDGPDSGSNESMTSIGKALKVSTGFSGHGLGSFNQLSILQLNDKDPLGSQAGFMAVAARRLAKKLGKQCALNIVQGMRNPRLSKVSKLVNSSGSAVVVSCEVYTAADAQEVVLAVDGIVDFVVLDSDLKSENSESIVNDVGSAVKLSQIIRYSDIKTWSQSVARIIQVHAQGNASALNANLIGSGHLKNAIEVELKILGVEITSGDSDFTIFCGPEASQEGQGLSSSIVIDAWLGGISESTIRKLQISGVSILRPDMHGEIQSEISGFIYLQSKYQANSKFKTKSASVSFGGVVDIAGTIVLGGTVDSPVVLGVADGKGQVTAVSELDKDTRDIVLAVRSEIFHELGKRGYGHD